MVHSRSIRRTSGNLERFEVEFGVRVHQDIRKVGDAYIITASASIDEYQQGITAHVDAISVVGKPMLIETRIENQRREVIFDLAGKVNIYLELHPDALLAPSDEEDTG